jgi:hypothetical protein
VSFASEPGRDDGSLPPVNVVIPDDARDLDRDVLAYRREMRAKRRRQRLLRLVRPLNRPQFGGPAAIVPLIAVCLALTLVGGALLSVATISPAEAPTTAGSSSPQAAARPTAAAGPTTAASLTDLPAATVQLDGHVVSARSLTSSVIALVPADCGCGPALQRLASQASAARVALYFVATGAAIKQLDSITSRYGGEAARPATDPKGVLTAAYRPAGLTVLLVFHDATAEVRKNLSGDFQLGTTMGTLALDGRGLSPSQPSASQPAASQPTPA